MNGVNWDLDSQLEWTRLVTDPFIAEVQGLQAYYTLMDERAGPGYGPIESQLLHCVVRSTEPEVILEVGSGVSTMITKEAAELNFRTTGRRSKLKCIEPFPSDFLVRDSDISLFRTRAQTADDVLFSSLNRGDILFIDSTHAVKTGSELPRLYLEIIPSLRAGVMIHIHDIFLPYPYSPDILYNLFDWQETTLLAALLTGNTRLRVLACLSALHRDRQPELQEIFPDYQPARLTRGMRPRGAAGHFPSSLWLITEDA
jgi:hypothetical protein